MKSTLSVLQGARAAAALAVLQMHAAQLAEKHLLVQPPDALSPLIAQGYLGVDFFFVLSGFIILHAHQSDPRTVAAAGSYLKKRITRIYVPYLPLALLMISFEILFSQMATDKHWSIFTSLTLVAWDYPPQPVLSVAWTLIHEVMFYAVFLLSYVTRGFAGLIVAWGALIGATILGGTAVPFEVLPPLAEANLRIFLDPINLEFVAGMTAAVAVRSLPPTWARASLTIGVLGLIVFFSMLGSGASRVWFGVAMAFVVAGLVWLEKAGRLRVPAPLVFLGDASYAIYLIHVPVIATGWLVAKQWSIPVSWSAAVLIGITVGLGFGLLYHVFVERPALSFVRRRGSKRWERQQISESGRAA